MKQVAKDGVSFWLPIVALTIYLAIYGAIYSFTSFPMF